MLRCSARSCVDRRSPCYVVINAIPAAAGTPTPLRERARGSQTTTIMISTPRWQRVRFVSATKVRALRSAARWARCRRPAAHGAPPEHMRHSTPGASTIPCASTVNCRRRSSATATCRDSPAEARVHLHVGVRQRRSIHFVYRAESHRIAMRLWAAARATRLWLSRALLREPRESESFRARRHEATRKHRPGPHFLRGSIHHRHLHNVRSRQLASRRIRRAQRPPSSVTCRLPMANPA